MLSITVIEYGAILQEFTHLPTGRNLVVKLPEPADYLADKRYLGACVGRFAGRISGGAFEVDDQRYPINTVNGVHLHGGQNGFSHKFWTIEEVLGGVTPQITLAYLSRHLEEGYPGNLQCKVTYRLNQDRLEIIHEAETDQATLVNMVNHSYFRLDDADSVSHYQLRIAADRILRTHDNLVPTGAYLEVEGSPYDFRKAKALGAILLDTPFVLNGMEEAAATVYSPRSQTGLRVFTNQPAMVVFTPDDLAAICLETQNYPDAPSKPHFPSSVLRPGAVYRNYAGFQVFTDP